jgi:hypothetical protein
VWETPNTFRNARFHLTGINNQNFIMQDEETGSWWQQITGEAIFGSSKGQRLNPVLHDELSFSVWKREHPDGRVLLPDDSKPWKRFSEDWEDHTAKMPVLAELNPDTRLSARTQIVGIKIGPLAKAYPLSIIKEQTPVLDHIGETPVLIMLADDKKSIRAFERTMDGRELEFFARPDSQSFRLVDTQTGSDWDFTGKAVGGQYTGRKLKRIAALNDYWFDWKTYHPDTEIYQ